MTDQDPLLFAPGTNGEYGARVAGRLGIGLAEHEEREFDDGEHKIRPLQSVRGGDVYVLQPLHGDGAQSVNERLIRLLFFLATLRDAHAGRLTAVVPYLPYARKDRRTRPRDPVTTRYLAQLFESVGVDRLVTMDVHNPAAFENAFRVPVVHLEARLLFAEVLGSILDGESPVVVSPDAGGYKRAERLRETLAARSGVRPGIAFMEKKRSEGRVSGEALVGDVEGRIAIIVDDLVSTGGTLVRAAATCSAAGARAVHAVATHGLFTGDAARVLAESPLHTLVVCDTVPPFRLPSDGLRGRLQIVDTTSLMAEAIGAMHRNGSVESLLAD